jgi:hypothetical protein
VKEAVIFEDRRQILIDYMDNADPSWALFESARTLRPFLLFDLRRTKNLAERADAK